MNSTVVIPHSEFLTLYSLSPGNVTSEQQHDGNTNALLGKIDVSCLVIIVNIMLSLREFVFVSLFQMQSYSISQRPFELFLSFCRKMHRQKIGVFRPKIRFLGLSSTNHPISLSACRWELSPSSYTTIPCILRHPRNQHHGRLYPQFRESTLQWMHPFLVLRTSVLQVCGLSFYGFWFI
jgi:hypothetical protein